ncbi:MAG: UPF0158 family protein [Bacteroidota bacterium]|uniref:Uncharacterized protein family (UPF0158) n=1 Tax=Algoriphagus faecimaris TaxID=686796 RepID=A0A1G6W953_9BACT|nr:UPF0158 family protein [Algoriphagus faecimaris]SDD62339.1 Uncharacterised protein family (UPF0158) [Algoriphagus faecimaris]
MLSLTEKEVDHIATQLLKGMVCFYQIDKKKIHQMPDDEDYFNYDLTEQEEDILDDIEANPDNFAEFTRMENPQEHQIMQDFIDRKVKERSLAEELVSALTKPKSMTAFKFLIDESKYKSEWTEYRKDKYLDWVKEQVDSFNYAED